MVGVSTDRWDAMVEVSIGGMSRRADKEMLYSLKVYDFFYESRKDEKKSVSLLRRMNSFRVKNGGVGTSNNLFRCMSGASKESKLSQHSPRGG